MKGDKKMGNYNHLLNPDSIWHEKNFSDASKEIANLLHQARNVFYALEKLDEDSDLANNFTGEFPSEIEKAKQLIGEMISNKGCFNYLQFKLRTIAEDVIFAKAFAAQAATVPLLKKCLNCDTHSREFDEECIDIDVYLYECPNCAETYDGDELSEDV